MYDDQHAYTAKPGSLKNIQINSEEKVSQASAVDAQLEKAAEEWTK